MGGTVAVECSGCMAKKQSRKSKHAKMLEKKRFNEMRANTAEQLSIFENDELFKQMSDKKDA